MRSGPWDSLVRSARRRLGAENLHIAGQYLWLALAESLGAVCGFAVVLLVARSFGPEGLGLVSLALNLIGYATIFATCGTHEYSIRVVSGREDLAPSQATSTVFLRLMLSVATYLALLGVVYAAPGLEAVSHLVVILGLTLFTTALNLTWLAQALQRIGALALSKLGLTAVNLGLLWLVLLRWSSLRSVAWTRVVSEMLVALGLVVWLARRGPGFGPLLPREGLGRVLRGSLPIAGTKLVRALTAGSDLVVVGLLVAAADVGVYSVAVRIFLLFVTLAGAYNLILLPRLVERGLGGHGALGQELRRSLALVMPVATVVLALVALAARPLIILLFGDQYAAAAPALRWLCLALWLNIVAMHMRYALLAVDRQRLDLLWTSLGAALHIALKFQLTMMLGITGAAMASVVAELFIVGALGWAIVKQLSDADSGVSE